MMTPEDFATARQLLFMTRKELAENVLGISCRMVNYIEEGKRKIPKDIEEKMRLYVSLRFRCVRDFLVQNIEGGKFDENFKLEEKDLNSFIAEKIVKSAAAHLLGYKLKIS